MHQRHLINTSSSDYNASRFWINANYDSTLNDYVMGSGGITLDNLKSSGELHFIKGIYSVYE